MSAAIDAVDFGTLRGGVLSLRAHLRSTQELLSRRLSGVAGGSTASRTLEQFDIAIFEPPVVGLPAAVCGDRARATVGLRGAEPAASAETIDGANGAAEWMR
jgi:hypothetical protein